MLFSFLSLGKKMYDTSDKKKKKPKKRQTKRREKKQKMGDTKECKSRAQHKACKHTQNTDTDTGKTRTQSKEQRELKQPSRARKD